MKYCHNSDLDEQERDPNKPKQNTRNEVRKKKTTKQIERKGMAERTKICLAMQLEEH